MSTPTTPTMLNRTACLVLLCFSLSAGSAEETETSKSATISNPLAFDMKSIKRGRAFYTQHCVLCHGQDGKGDTQMREFLKTHPANLSDDQWIYGHRDSDIFDVIKQGRTERDMPAFEQQLNDERIWQLMHYLRYLGGDRP